MTKLFATVVMTIVAKPTYMLMFSLIVIPTAVCQTYENAVHLHSDLLTNYSMTVRPLANQSEPMIINLTFSLLNILELDEIVGKLSVVGIINMVWKDCSIMWEPSEYGYINSTKLQTTSVWQPNLVIVNLSGAVTSMGERLGHYLVHYLYTGVAVWSPAEVLSATCDIDITNYPFDTQTCKIFLTQWESSIKEFQLNSAKELVLTKHLSQNGEWELLQATARAEILAIENDFHVSYFTIVLKLKRLSPYAFINVISPIMLVSLLNLLVFILPPESGERASFATTILLSKAVFFTVIGENIPRSSLNMAKIFLFLLSNFILSCFIMATVVINLRIYHVSDTTSVPSCFISLLKLANCKREKLSRVKAASIVESNAKEATIEEDDDGNRADGGNDGIKVTWVDVSTALDKLLGTISVLWLLVSSITYFSIVL